MNTLSAVLLRRAAAAHTHRTLSIAGCTPPGYSCPLPLAVPYRSGRGKMLAGPLLARSQSYFSQASVSEYVEDSEPEREQRRSQEKARRKKKRPEVVIPPAEVIELTDSEASYHAEIAPTTTPGSQKKPIAVIDISGMCLRSGLNRIFNFYIVAAPDSSDAPLPQATAQFSVEAEKELAEDDSAVIPEVEGR